MVIPMVESVPATFLDIETLVVGGRNKRGIEHLPSSRYLFFFFKWLELFNGLS